MILTRSQRSEINLQNSADFVFDLFAVYFRLGDDRNIGSKILPPYNARADNIIRRAWQWQASLSIMHDAHKPRAIVDPPRVSREHIRRGRIRVFHLYSRLTAEVHTYSHRRKKPDFQVTTAHQFSAGHNARARWQTSILVKWFPSRDSPATFSGVNHLSRSRELGAADRLAEIDVTR